MKCPSCGAEAKGKFCEYCGSEMPKENVVINITNNYYGGAEKQQSNRVQDTTESKAQKTTKNKGKISKRTWWILGWIFIFPVPITILLLRNKKMKPAVKYSIIAVMWLLVFVIGISNNNEAEIQQNDVPAYTESIQSTESVNEPTEISKIENTYADDDVVNRFITEFNEQSNFEIAEISKGNIRTKYFGSANGRYLEMINANDAGAEAFCLTINGGQEESDKQSMYEVFREAVQVLDPSLTDEMIDAAISEFNNKDVLIEGYAVGDSLTITFVPIKELSYGKNSCRIDIYASNYK